MSIWKYSDTVESDLLYRRVWSPEKCRFCGMQMQISHLDDHWAQTDASYLELHRKLMLEGEDSYVNVIGMQEEPQLWLVENGSPSELYVTAFVCPACGWWSIDKVVALDSPHNIWDMLFRAEGALRSLDVNDVHFQLDEVRAFLRARYESRFSIHPRKFEEVVGSVFGDLGYEATVTAYTRDGGIDVVLQGRNGDLVGVQVKRFKNRIKVEQIRSFVGALMLGGFVRGVFITTSDYQLGVQALTRQAGETCVPIDLLDERAFFEALGIAQLTGSDPISDVRNMLVSDHRPELFYIDEFPRNSL
jgi:restriction system protein